MNIHVMSTQLLHFLLYIEVHFEINCDYDKEDYDFQRQTNIFKENIARNRNKKKYLYQSSSYHVILLH